MKLIDADYLYNWIKAASNPYGKPTLDYDTALKIMEMIENMTDQRVTEWFPADQPPEVDENGYSEDVVVKVKWWDNDISKNIGWYSEKYGWNNAANVKVIEWTHIPK